MWYTSAATYTKKNCFFSSHSLLLFSEWHRREIWEKTKKCEWGGGSFKDIILPVKNFWTFLWPYRYSPSFLSSKDLFIVQCDQQVQITRFAYDFFLLKYNRNFKQIYYNLYWQISDIIFDVEWSLINNSCIT